MPSHTPLTTAALAAGGAGPGGGGGGGGGGRRGRGGGGGGAPPRPRVASLRGRRGRPGGRGRRPAGRPDPWGRKAGWAARRSDGLAQAAAGRPRRGSAS